MYNIKTLNKIAKIGLEELDKALFTVSDDAENPDGILVRSAAMHDMEFGSNLLAIGRAGAGVNNIPVDRCAEEGIVVFNTPGANANAVKELVIAGLFLASRKITAGVEWTKTLKGNGADISKMVEKGKSNFGGCEIKGKTLGVIGLGAIGVMVANAACHLGMKVIGYDPYISVDAAWNLNHHIVKAKAINEIYENSDYITVHVPLNSETKGSINAQAFEKCKNGLKLLNFSRGELVNYDDLKAAMESGKVSSYVTDFASEEVLALENAVIIPHLGASTAEAEDNCAVMAAREISDYILNGNITNSVNFPNVSQPRVDGGARVCVIHKNIPKMLTQISALMGEYNANIENMVNKSKGENAYTVLDVIGKVPENIKEDLEKIEGIIRVRVIL
ncbi:MAG: 3-phosphoglycerate dehydrogenase [Ruminococcaceae bacterium]|nr:3-phosphoglycerate dehydrogenase [Oscillospiraceae bacterium]